MKVIKILLLITFILPISIFAQQSKPQNIRLRKDKPSVYISFERFEKIKREEENEEFIFFRLHNNTRWKIQLQMSGGLSEKYNDVRLYYAIRNDEGNMIEGHFCRVCSINWLPSTKSLLFAISRDLLKEDRRLDIEFQYEWQADSAREVSNIVSFWNSDLPK
jgi:hypothetical protein